MLLKQTVLSCILWMSTLACMAQNDLSYYINQAVLNSPLIQDNQNLSDAAKAEAERLKAFYTKPQITLTANYLFAPVISSDNGKNELILNPSDPVKYNGYDMAASNGGAYQGLLNVNQPVLNGIRGRTASEQILVTSKINENAIRLTAHDIEKFVTDQYILCIQDLKQMNYLKSLIAIVEDQKNMISKLAANGIAKQSDLSLITIEYQTQFNAWNTFNATYRRDLMDLNILCGINDTSYVILPEINLSLKQEEIASSAFTERFRLDSLNLRATQKMFDLKYKPQLNLYANTGLNGVYIPSAPNRFGASAGVSFTMFLYDGKQRTINNKRTEILIRSTESYKNIFIIQNTVRKSKALTEIRMLEERMTITEAQLEEYKKLMDYYRQEVRNGQLSVVIYINVLKSLALLQRDYVLMQANKQLLINTYNYWNW
ncbi:TolC family protein [Cytophaga aurantiaca]|uniref:TolC family protein n=1 Tax=Cytophaga aurantiaca TaxID=29530 RepID=UPI0003A9542F|nr:TolC family protein [Cytophaga aurantiaca]